MLIISLIASPLPAEHPPGFNPKRHMTIDEVEPGMRGYGMSVFHGTKIEPFTVEVISVQRGFNAGKAVVWIRCPDDRMQLTGPVQGMSGSPIYLWDNNEKNPTPGRGGRMIGAFAFGHRLGKDCYAGVQPITNMLETAARAKASHANQPLQASNGGDPAMRDKTLAAAFLIAQQNQLDENATWRLKMLSRLSGFDPSKQQPPMQPTQPDHQLSLPVAVGNAQQAALLAPLFNAHGLAAQAAPVPPSSLAPHWIDSKTIEVAPGGVFAIPLTFGPLEMAAIGTTTEVLPDGTALAFGHQFFAQGPIAVPMGPGFVHFVQPNISASFKLGGSLRVTGAVVRDESSAVVGIPGAQYPTVPATIKIRHAGDPTLDREDQYTIVHHDRLLPSLVGSVTSASLTSDTELPRLNTLEVNAQVQFENGRKLSISEMSPNATAANVMVGLVPPIATLMENDFNRLKVQSIEATVTVHEEVKAATVIGGTVDQSVVEPGDKLVVHVRVMPFRQDVQLHRIELQVPKDVPDGEYVLTLGGARSYAQQMAMTRPHLMRADNTDELFDAVQQLIGVKDNALYAVLTLAPTNNLAIGRSELPHLPSSRMALLAVETSTRTTPYLDSVEVVKELPYVIVNDLALPVTVQKEDPAAPRR